MKTAEFDLTSVLNEEADFLGQQLYGKDTMRRAAFANRLLDICTLVQGKDMLVIHNPGGWGSTPLDDLLQWERSIIDGVVTTIERMGYSLLLVQHFRGGRSQWARMKDMKEETYFLFKGQSRKVKELAAEVRFIARHFSNLKILLLGVSQGAAFSNAVMREVGELHRLYSIELGIFFPHMSRRVVTERTLAIDDNGQVPDPIARGNLRVGFKAYITALYRWLKYRLHGQPQRFTYCINTPGHDYNWEYPEVRRQIREFLKIKFGTKGQSEVGLL